MRRGGRSLKPQSSCDGCSELALSIYAKPLVFLFFLIFIWLGRVLVASCRIFCWGADSVVVTGEPRACRLSGCSVACGILVPQPGITPVSPSLRGRFLTTGPPGKSSSVSETAGVIVVVIQSPSRVQLFATPWTAACQAPLSLTILEFAQVYVHWISDAI